MKATGILVFNILFASFIFYQTGFAKSDSYIPVKWITITNDTISGFIKPKIVQDKFLMAKIESTNNKSIRLSSDSIKYVQYKGQNIFLSQNIVFLGKNSKIFIEMLFSGVANLYQGQYEDLGKLFFIELGSNIYMPDKLHLKQFFESVFGSCMINSKPVNYAYTKSSMIEVVQSYSLCKNPDLKINKNPIDKYEFKYSIGAKINYNYGNFNFPESAYYAKGDYSRISSLGYGIIGEAQISQHLFFRTEISYLKKESSADPVNTALVDPTISSKVKFDLSYIDWPLYVGYYFGNEKTRPFLGAGLNMGFLISGEIQDEPYKLWPLDNGPPYYKFGSFDFGLLVIGGLSIQLNNNSAIQLNIKYTDSSTDYTLKRKSALIGGYGIGSTNLNTKRVEIGVIYTYTFSSGK